MIESFTIIVQQVIVLSILLVIGYVGTKFGMIDDAVSKGLTDIAINFSIPCMLIRAFRSEYNSQLLKLFFLEVLISIILHVSAGLIGAGLVRGRDGRTKALRLCIIFGNVGFVGFPLMRSILGDLGVFYASGF
ncbi:MAG: AEC family transporter, partial [Firmicutes bacterium]|nr:AEC family transporter [Bacillota bacterium]